MRSIYVLSALTTVGKEKNFALPKIGGHGFLRGLGNFISQCLFQHFTFTQAEAKFKSVQNSNKMMYEFYLTWRLNWRKQIQKQAASKIIHILNPIWKLSLQAITL